MMRRKFKHILTGGIAIARFPLATGYYMDTDDPLQRFYLPNCVVENSNDWEEMQVKIITTVDGFDRFEGDGVYCISKDSMEYKGVVTITKDTDIDDYLYFNIYRNLTDYVAKNKKRFSEQDIVDAIHEVLKTRRYDSFVILREKLGIKWEQE